MQLKELRKEIDQATASGHRTAAMHAIIYRNSDIIRDLSRAERLTMLSALGFKSTYYTEVMKILAMIDYQDMVNAKAWYARKSGH